MEDYKGLSREQFGAIRQSIKLGRTLQEDHPEIAVIYGYYSQRDIPKMLDIQSRYSVIDSVALNGVHRAIVGHKEGFGIEGYVGLITDEEELKRLREGRRAAGARICGQKLYEQGLGMFGRTAEQHSEDGRKAYEQGLANRTAKQHSEDGQKGGQTTYEEGLGIHAQTLEEKREVSRKGGQTAYEQRLGIFGRTSEQMSEDGRKGNLAQGKTPWSDEEKEFAYMLSQEQEYQHPNGRHAGKSNNELIAFGLNIEYHDCKEVRSAQAVALRLFKYRKSLVDIVV